MERSQWRRVGEFVDPRRLPFVEMRSRGELPHLYKDGVSYFVAFRLRDAVVCGAGGTPAGRKKKAGETPAPQERRAVEEVAASCEAPVRLGSCVLERPEIARMVEEALLHFHGERYNLVAWCIMPNHVHAVFTALGLNGPSDILHSWKSYTAHRAVKLLTETGVFWERESFDHVIRSWDDFEYFVDYVEQNPVAAGLCDLPAQWPFSSAGCGAGNWGAGVPPAEEEEAGGTPAPQEEG